MLIVVLGYLLEHVTFYEQIPNKSVKEVCFYFGKH